MTIGKAPFERLWLRDGIYFYRRWIPNTVAHLDTRKIVRASLGTGDRIKAARKAVEFEDHLEQLWVALLAGEGEDAWARYNAAVERARLEGFSYRSSRDLAVGASDEIVRREQSLIDRPADKSARKALLGGAEREKYGRDHALEATRKVLAGMAYMFVEPTLGAELRPVEARQ